MIERKKHSKDTKIEVCVGVMNKDEHVMHFENVEPENFDAVIAGEANVTPAWEQVQCAYFTGASN